MATKYLIMRTRSVRDPQLHFALARGWPGPDSSLEDLSIETVDGRERDGAALRADPQNVSVLDADVVLSLIEPKSLQPGSAVPLAQAGSLQMPHGLLAVGAHTTRFTGQGVTVAVLDTGIDAAHPAFASQQIVQRDFTGAGANEADASDSNGHGTHCAGTICGGLVDGIRVGVAPGVTKLCVGKVLGRRGGTLGMLLRAMFWAVIEERAQVVSMSLSYDLAGNVERLIRRGVPPALAADASMRQQSEILKGIATLRAFLQSQSPNVVFVAATGNESGRPHFALDAGLPAAELLAVGAVGPNGDRWSVADFSNGRAHLVAPGIDVVSAAIGGGWSSMSGTSMATPHIAGLAALWFEKLREEKALVIPDMVRTSLIGSATRQPLTDHDLDAIGAGMPQSPQ